MQQTFIATGHCVNINEHGKRVRLRVIRVSIYHQPNTGKNDSVWYMNETSFLTLVAQ